MATKLQKRFEETRSTMHRITILALAAASLAAGSALADQTYKVDKIEINGVKSVNVNDLRAVLKEKPGDKVTIQDIIADQDVLVKKLETLNVTGGVKTSKRDKPGNHIDIIYDVNDNGVEKPVVKTVTRMVTPKLGHMMITGNKLVDSDVLLTAAAMKEGDELTQASMNDSAKRIMDAYSKALKKVHKTASVAITAEHADAAKPGEVDLTWKLTVTDMKRAASTEDTGGYGEQ
jgi:outer membrane protein assembly factor BamA